MPGKEKITSLDSKRRPPFYLDADCADHLLTLVDAYERLNALGLIEEAQEVRRSIRMLTGFES